MGARLKNKNDIKIFILYLLQNINYPLDFPTINDIVVQDEYVNYFDFAECFAEILDMGHVVEEISTDEKTGEKVTRYRISPCFRLIFRRADGCKARLDLLHRDCIAASPLGCLLFALHVQRKIPHDFAEIGQQRMRLCGRNRIPRAEVGIAHALLRILRACKDVVRELVCGKTCRISHPVPECPARNAQKTGR